MFLVLTPPPPFSEPAGAGVCQPREGKPVTLKWGVQPRAEPSSRTGQEASRGLFSIQEFSAQEDHILASPLPPGARPHPILLEQGAGRGAGGAGSWARPPLPDSQSLSTAKAGSASGTI